MNDSASRYLRSKEIYFSALERELHERSQFVSDACAGDAALLDDVQQLLLEDTQPATALDLLDAASLTPAGYHLVRELGRGGMGVVWLAERDTGGFRQRVALKLLGRDALRDPDRHARFLVERRILAGLDHPHIARLLDGGTLPDGTPYIAMEYVDGKRLDHWASQARPSPNELLRMFVAICRAVQAAHQRLVVHRDLKPANIFIDAYGEPKLLDFGIAKLLDTTTHAVQAETVTGMQMLTPRYAAPEQVRGGPTTTATDVYALGAVLYELLTGVSAYGLVSAATPEQLRAVCERDPVRPSAARAGDDASYTGMPRGLLRGDLDAIVLKSLRKLPEERYDGAGAIADDLENFLDGRPVLARAGSTRYAFAKFVSRHRYLAASVLTVAVVLASAAGLLLRQLTETRTQRDLAALERDKATQVTNFLVDLLRNADPSRARGEQVTVRDALERGEAELEIHLADHPETKAYLYRQLSLVQSALGNPTHGIDLAEQALALLRTTPRTTPAERDETRLAHAQAQVLAGRGADAMAELHEIRAAASARGDDLLQADALIAMSQSAREQKLDVAVAREAQALARQLLFQTLGIDDLASALALAGDASRRPALERLATLAQDECSTLSDLHETDAAWMACNRTADLKGVLWPPDHPTQLTVRGTLATLSYVRGDKARALELRRQLLATTRKVYGEGHKLTAYAMFNLGVSLKDANAYAEAENMYRGALGMLQKQIGSEHRATLVVSNNLGNLLTDMGRANEGLALHRETLAKRRKALGGRHGDVAQSLMNVASAEARLGRHADAIAHNEEAWAMYRDLLGPAHHDTVLAQMQLAQRQFDAARYADAEHNARETLVAYEKMDESLDQRGAARFLLARTEWQLGQHDAALRLATQAHEEARLHGGSGFEERDVADWMAKHPAR